MSVAPHAEPFFAEANPTGPDGQKVGVLLCHGFTGSPASMVPWGRYLAEQGFGVAVPRLPGHGTTWQDMNKTTWRDWYGEVERAFEKLRAECDQVVVGGLSMGATLALLLAANRQSEVAGVISVNVSVDNKDPRRFALPVLKRFIPSFPGITDDVKKPGVTESGYDRLPLHAAHEFIGLCKQVQTQLPRVTQPLLEFKSSVDHVADPGSHKLLLNTVSSRDVTERILENSYHVATLDNDAPLIFDESAEFVRRVTGP
ncbi:MAG: alpha/beta hydrolase [Nocardioides sp.]